MVKQMRRDVGRGGVRKTFRLNDDERCREIATQGRGGGESPRDSTSLAHRQPRLRLNHSSTCEEEAGHNNKPGTPYRW